MVAVFNYKINISFAGGHFEITLKESLSRCSVAGNYWAVWWMNLIAFEVRERNP